MTETDSPSASFPKSSRRLLLRWILCLIGLGTIFPLLGHLYGLAPMPTLTGLLLLPAILVYGIAYFFSIRKGDWDLRQRFERGFIGGLAGIAGYDLVRVPIHHAGYNPFAAIQSYGVYVTGAEESSLLTDLAGILYHTGNGLFFAIMFTLVIDRNRFTFLLALLWALALEGFAVFTIFGEVYHLRDHPGATALAFFAHIFYGMPLAWAATRKDLTKQQLTVAAVAALAGLASVFFLVCPAGGYTSTITPGLNMIETGIQPRWSRIEVGESLEIKNSSAEPVTLEFSVEGIPEAQLESGTSTGVTFDEPGIIQIRAQRTDWRSVFVIVEEEGFPTPND